MMPDKTIDQKLREMAEHRGFKLVRSRKRKAGIGDYGKFGLTQADGKPLFGIGEAGLTASAKDIEAYLRQGSVSTWKASAESVPARPALAENPKRSEKADDNVRSAPVIRPRRRNAATRNAVIRNGNARKAAPESRKAQSAEEPTPGLERASRASSSRRSAPPEARPTARVPAKPPAAPVPSPRLRVRAARPADAAALAKLLGQLVHVEIEELGIARNLDAARKAKGGMVIAEMGMLVGCCGWALLPTIQYGLIGRITMILVDEEHRLRGIAAALVEAASAALKKAGCTRVEAMSDIEIRNGHNFFRALKFEQTSYRFAKALDRDS
jgi:N-acetylglutamate synthase-like GNAT family acetyltransferase